jgi:hypothetical protein
MIATACRTSTNNGPGNSDGGHDETGTGGSPGVDASGGDATGAEGSSAAGEGGSGGGVEGGGGGEGGTEASAGVSDAGGTQDSAGGAGDAGASGDGGAVCPLPTTFHWTSTGPLAPPQNGSLSLKDFSDVVYNNQHIVYFSTVNDTGNWGGGMTTFTDWSQMGTATQHALGGGFDWGVAPALIYFTPKNIWVLMYEWGQWNFNYRTSTDPTNPSGWSAANDLYVGNSIDETVICTSTTCYLFFADDNGSVYRASMPIGDFPSAFTNDSASVGGNPSGPTTVLQDTTANLFEAVEVYTVKGANQYLMIVEAEGSVGRYFRSFTATDLGGTWTGPKADESSPFAGAANVTFSGTAWTSSISSGDLVRNNPDETQTIDPCNLQFLYQGVGPTSGLQYYQLPYQPALLTLVQ